MGPQVPLILPTRGWLLLAGDRERLRGRRGYLGNETAAASLGSWPAQLWPSEGQWLSPECGLFRAARPQGSSLPRVLGPSYSEANGALWRLFPTTALFPPRGREI